MTDDELIDNFKTDQVNDGLSDLTVDAYCSDLRQFRIYLWTNGKLLLDARPIDIDQYLTLLSGQGIQNRSQARKLGSLRKFYSELFLEGQIEHDPTIFAEVRKTWSDVQRSLPEITISQKLDTMMAAAMETMSPLKIRDWVVIELLYDCLFRPSELADLVIENIDFESGKILVLGKGKKERVVELIPAASYALNFYLTYSRRLLLGPVTTQTVFVSNRGKRLTRQWIWRIVKVAFPTAFPYCMRHSGAKHLAENGADPKKIKVLLGHGDESTTAIYTEGVSPRRLAEAHQRFHPRAKCHRGPGSPKIRKG